MRGANERQQESEKPALVRGENLNEDILVPMARPTYGSEVPRLWLRTQS
jgi:hypothetical protein